MVTILKSIAICFLVIDIFGVPGVAACEHRRPQEAGAAIIELFLEAERTDPTFQKMHQSPAGEETYPHFRVQSLKYDGWDGSIRNHLLALDFQNKNEGRIPAAQATIEFRNDKPAGFVGDRLILPTSAFSCVAAPGDTIYIGDGDANHVAQIRSIDIEKDQVILKDPWAYHSFLHDTILVNVTARAFTENKLNFLEVRLSDLEKILYGIKLHPWSQLPFPTNIQYSVKLQETIVSLLPNASQCEYAYWLNVHMVAVVLPEETMAAMTSMAPQISKCDGTILSKLWRWLPPAMMIAQGDPIPTEFQNYQWIIDDLPWYIGLRTAKIFHRTKHYHEHLDFISRLGRKYPFDIDITLQVAQACEMLRQNECAIKHLNLASEKLAGALNEMFTIRGFDEQLNALQSDVPYTLTTSIWQKRLAKIYAVNTWIKQQK